MGDQGLETMGRVVAELTLANNEDVMLARRGALAPEQVRQIQIQGVVDSGATRLVLPESVVTQLGLRSTGETRVRYADQRRGSRPIVQDVRVTLLGREGVFSALVEPDRTDALIGAIVLEDLDFLVDCTKQALYPRDPDMIVSEVE
jgi:clan AA aspartic protease